MLLETEGILNSRPLTYVYDEIGYQPLTPSHLLHGRRLPFLAGNLEFNVDAVEDAATHTKRFCYLVKTLNHFSSRWKQEYLTDLREFHRNRLTGQPNIQKGDVVLIKEENLKRNSWKLGLVEELVKGKDGVIRGAKVSICNKGKKDILSRPLQKLIPLEVQNENGEEGLNDEKTVKDGRMRMLPGLSFGALRQRTHAGKPA
ncbi:MAG: hypothetical protein CMB97_01460 [Flavobacteriaceae bacterium]|nr:hypothetical protein [Flavobacteriaceae bacterium]